MPDATPTPARPAGRTVSADLADAPSASCCCVAGQFSDVEMAAPDIVEIAIEFEGRRTASIHLDFFQKPRRRQTELLCTEGIILVEFAQWNHCTLSTAGADGVWSHAPMVTDRDDMFRAEDSAFLRAIAENSAVECGIVEARKSVEIIERAMADAGIVGEAGANIAPNRAPF